MTGGQKSNFLPVGKVIDGCSSKITHARVTEPKATTYMEVDAKGKVCAMHAAGLHYLQVTNL